MPAREVNVVEGETTKVRFELVRHVVYEARQELVQLRAHYTSYVCTQGVVYACSSRNEDTKNHSWTKTIDEKETGPIEAFFAEIQWKDSTS